MNTNQTEIVNVVRDRDVEYGDAWAMTGVVLQTISYQLNQLLLARPRMYLPFVNIVMKLMRILASPDNKDHWRDIAGYATLVLNDDEDQNA